MSEKEQRKKESRLHERITLVRGKKKSAVRHGGKPSMPNTVTQNRLELLFTVVGKSKAEFYLDLIQSFEVNMQVLTLAHGTADETLRSFIGLTDSEKAVICSVVQEKKIPDLLRTLEEKFRTIKNGKGIAFTVPLTSVIGTLLYGFLSNNKMAIPGG